MFNVQYKDVCFVLKVESVWECGRVREIEVEMEKDIRRFALFKV